MTTQPDDRLPLTVLIPDGPGGVIDAYDQSAALRLAIVDRQGVPALGDDWDHPGNYLLLDPIATDGTWGAYVGKAPAGVRSRLLAHVRQKEFWTRAVLVQRDTTHGYNSAHVGWLEGRLYDLLAAAESARLNNGQRPRDDTLAQYDRLMLEAAIDPISRLLRLIGYDPATPDDTPLSPARRTPVRHGVTIADLIHAGALAPGTRLVSTVLPYPADATVNTDGTISWNDTNYPTLSAAAVAVRGGKATNGWSF